MYNSILQTFPILDILPNIILNIVNNIPGFIEYLFINIPILYIILIVLSSLTVKTIIGHILHSNFSKIERILVSAAALSTIAQAGLVEYRRSGSGSGSNDNDKSEKDESKSKTGSESTKTPENTGSESTKTSSEKGSESTKTGSK